MAGRAELAGEALGSQAALTAGGPVQHTHVGTLKVMPGDWHLYLDSNQLATRGWTAALIERFLGKPDLWMPVNHWANWKGKRTYFLERIELAEASPEFRAEFAKSARRRKLSKRQLTAFEKCRAESLGAVAKWRKEEAKAAAERQSGPATPSKRKSEGRSGPTLTEMDEMGRAMGL